jgi:predicted nucleotidyltransferase
MNYTDIAQKLYSIFEKYRSVGLAYLFGSHATGAVTQRSDVDIAVYFSEPDVIRRHHTLFALSGDISRALETDKIDIHSMNDIHSPLLKFRIMQEGMILFEREPYRIILEPRILNEYEDFLYLLRKHNLTSV